MMDASPGTVVSVRGSVVDVRFDTQRPPIHTVLHAGTDPQIAIEVLAQSDARHVRGMADQELDQLRVRQARSQAFQQASQASPVFPVWVSRYWWSSPRPPRRHPHRSRRP